MLVVIGDTLFDGRDLPICLILGEGDRRNLAALAPEATIFCEYPSEIPEQEINAWLDQVEVRAEKHLEERDQQPKERASTNPA